MAGERTAANHRQWRPENLVTPCLSRFDPYSTFIGRLRITMLRTAVSAGFGCQARRSMRRMVLVPHRLTGVVSQPPRTINYKSGLRFLSSEAPKDGAKQEKAKPAEDENAIVLTPGEKVVAASRLTMWGGAAVFAAVCAYYIGRELIPT